MYRSPKIRRQKASFFAYGANLNSLIKRIKDNDALLTSVTFFDLGSHDLSKIASALKTNTSLVHIRFPSLKSSIYNKADKRVIIKLADEIQSKVQSNFLDEMNKMYVECDRRADRLKYIFDIDDMLARVEQNDPTLTEINFMYITYQVLEKLHHAIQNNTNVYKVRGLEVNTDLFDDDKKIRTHAMIECVLSKVIQNYKKYHDAARHEIIDSVAKIELNK
jgi:hypothetical protein